jgi:hypothetical protein
MQMITIACLVLFSAGGQLFSDVTKTALTYGTFGAYIIIPVFLIAGFVIGEETPVLLVSSKTRMLCSNETIVQVLGR